MSTTEQEIERLVEEISRAIQRGPADQRAELRSYASSLVNDIATGSPVPPSQTSGQTERRPFGLVAAGLALLVIGAGFALMITPIGLTLMALGCGSRYLGWNSWMVDDSRRCASWQSGKPMKQFL